MNPTEKEAVRQSKFRMVMDFPQSVFRANDIRGLLEEVTPDLARRAGRALVEKTNARKVVVGRDMRSTSPALQEAAIEGILAAGADALDIGMCTTSMYNFAVAGRPDVNAGLMVTASHNPPQYNGIKMALHDGHPLSGIEMMDAIFNTGVLASSPVGTRTSEDILDAYLDKRIEGISPGAFVGVRVVVDYGNGMGALTVRPLLERLGISFVELYPEPDARFPNHESNPAKEETLADLKAAVLREKADVGIALDGDADRVAFVDNEGITVRGDQTLALLAREILATRPGGKVIVAPNMGWTVTDMILESGGVPVEDKVGRTFVIKAMRANKAVLGGEVSSHFFFKETDGLESVDYAIARVLSVWRRSGETFADLVRPLRRFANSGEVNTEVHDKIAVMAAIEATYGPAATSVNRLDGIRCEFGRDWWFIVRPSNNEPLLRLIVEAKDQDLMKEKRDEIVAMMKAL